MAVSKKILPHAHLLADASRTSLLALKESADAFPPLKAAVGGVLAVWDVAERAKQARSHAYDVAHRTQDILHVVADAVPDPRTISPPMLKSIQRFTELLEDIRQEMAGLTRTGFASRVFHLNRNERKLQDIRERLDNAYRDFMAASALRLEAQHNETRIEIQKLTIANNTDLSKLLFSARFQNVCSFFGRPLAREAASSGVIYSLLSGHPAFGNLFIGHIPKLLWSSLGRTHRVLNHIPGSHWSFEILLKIFHIGRMEVLRR
ncbi:hypothetical protein C8R45DRAFT_1016057 [Mycena sanguinolenta]|nr:hypothetical protein C8R45DRAFT_1016057 [Mycena sanguinolenta]